MDLDPDETVNEFCRHFPHGDRRVGGVIREMAEIVDAPPEYRDEFGHEDRRRRAPEINVLPRPTWPSALAGAGRALRLRLTSLRAGPALRARRTPRTSS